MKETIKKAFLGRIIFSGTSLLFFLGFATYTNLPTQNTGDTITQSIWNNLINTVNSIGNSQLGVDQSRQDLTSSRTAGTNYTNNTGKPIMVSIRISVTGAPTVTLKVDGIITNSLYVNRSYQNNIELQAIIPNNSVYVLMSGVTIAQWAELR